MSRGWQFYVTKKYDARQEKTWDNYAANEDKYVWTMDLQWTCICATVPPKTATCIIEHNCRSITLPFTACYQGYCYV